MKRSFSRILSILLALVLTVGLLPTLALAGPSTEILNGCGVYVTYPIAGAHPNLTGIPSEEEPHYTVEAVHFFELDAQGMPIGAFLSESRTFQAGKTYACQVILVPDEWYGFGGGEYSYCYVNGHYAGLDLVDGSGAAYFTAYLKCPERTVTLTFDANGSAAEPPAPLQVPEGGCLWDVIPNFGAVGMPDQPYETFLGWSRDPFSTVSEDSFSYYSEIDEDLTLYAIWKRVPRSADLYVSLPANCLQEEIGGPEIAVPGRSNYEVEPDLISVSPEGVGNPEYHPWYPLSRGATYYSRATLYMDNAGTLPQVRLHGAELISLTRMDSSRLNVVFSVTVPAGNSLTSAGVWIETPKNGQDAITAHPTVAALTPGLEMSVQGWYTDPDLTGDWYEGTLVGGTTYYALVRINGGVNYAIASDTLALDVQGKNAELVRMVDLASAEGVPNLVGAVVAVTVPKTYDLAVEVPYGGKIRPDSGNGNWVTVIDFGNVEEGPITLEAKADPTHMFSMWYDANTYEILSRSASYTFPLDRDVNIKAAFVVKTPFVDVRAKDYFYEPVLWAIRHDPVVTSGVDDTHFGPKQPCTREQIVTFLWNACGQPEPQTSVNPFRDVKASRYYYKAVLWAVESGITSGVEEGKFGVGQPCTRSQAVTFLWNASGKPMPESDECPFTDVKPGKFYYNAVLWAVENDVTSGTTETTFGPNETCTRGQIITFLYKVYGPKG